MTQLEALVDALLWEGHQLDPFAPELAKDAPPAPFGILYPPAHAARSPHRFDRLRLQCIAIGSETFSATVHFLHGAEARRVELTSDDDVVPFASGDVRGDAALSVEPLGDVRRVTVDVHNRTDVPEGLTRFEALAFSLLSTHVVVRCGTGGRFASPIAPPRELVAPVMTCSNVNVFPVLATPADDAVLGATIPLPDHPRIATEDRGSLVDPAAVEEALLLHVLSLGDGGREQLADAGRVVRAMVERAVTASPEDIMALRERVTVRDGPLTDVAGAVLPGEERVEADGRAFMRGGHVILHPARTRGAQDRLLEGRPATIERILIDFDDEVHLCLSVDDGPGHGPTHHTGRPLYLRPAEVELIDS